MQKSNGMKSQIKNPSEQNYKDEEGEFDQISNQYRENQIKNSFNFGDQSIDYYHKDQGKMLDHQQQKQKQGDQDLSLLDISQSIKDIMIDKSKSNEQSQSINILKANRIENLQMSCDLQDSSYDPKQTSIQQDSYKNDYTEKQNRNEESYKQSLIDTNYFINSINPKQTRGLEAIKLEPSIIVCNLKQMNGKRRDNFLKSQFVSGDNIWKRKWMQIFYLLSKIRRIARENAMFFRPHTLRKHQVQLIGDQGSSQQYQSSLYQSGKYELGRQFSFQNFSKYMTFRNYRKMIKWIIKYLGWIIYLIQKIYNVYLMVIRYIFKHTPLFHYLSGYYIVWETIIFISSSVLFIYIPFEYSFQVDRNQFFSIYFKRICPVVYGIDIFVRANTKSTEIGTYIENHLQIFNKYAKSDMIPDVLSLVCLNYKFFQIDATYFFFFIRITKSFRILDIFKEQFLLRMKISGIIALFNLLAQVLYFAHLISCIWNAVGSYESNFNQGWIVKYDTQNVAISIRYLRSFYYSVITMTTIGYGDYTPQTDLEKLIVILIAFVSCGVFGYSINSIGSILNNFKQQRNIYLQELAKINKYFTLYDVDLELQARARKYLDYIYTDKKEDLICSIDQLCNLTEYLQNEIKVNVYTKRLKQLRLFQEILSEETLNRISLKISEKIFSHDQDIIESNQLSEPILCIVHSGAVTQYVQNEDNKKVKEIKTFNEGQFFGLENFIQGTYQSDFSHKSHGISSILKVQLRDFLDAIMINPEEYEKFQFAKDEIIFNQNQKAVGISCDSCQQKFHSLRKCPFIFYEGKRETILRRYFLDINKQIKSFKRSLPKKRFKTLLENDRITKDAQMFKNDNSNNSFSDITSDDGDDQNLDDEEVNDSKSYLIKQKSLKINTNNMPQRNLSVFNMQDPMGQILTPQKQERLSQQSFGGFFPQQQFTGFKKQATSEEIGQSQADFSKNMKGGNRNKLSICENQSEADSYDANSTKKKEVNINQRHSYNYSTSIKNHQININPQISDENQQKRESVNQKVRNSNRYSEAQEKNYFEKRRFSLLLQHFSEISNNNNPKQKQNQQNYEPETETEFYMYDFECLKEFEFYYPSQNYQKIVDQENQLMKSSHQVKQFRKLIKKQLVTYKSTKQEKLPSFNSIIDNNFK